MKAIVRVRKSGKMDGTWNVDITESGGKRLIHNVVNKTYAIEFLNIYYWQMKEMYTDGLEIYIQ